MRLIMFVLSLTISACAFVWKMELLADPAPAAMAAGAPYGDAEGSLFAQFMNRAMALMPDGGSVPGMAMADPSAGGMGSLGQMPATQAMASQIEAQLKTTNFGGGGGTFAAKPKDFSARFVKARPTP